MAKEHVLYGQFVLWRVRMMTAICRIAIGLLLLSGGTIKARRFRDFRSSVLAFGIVKRNIWSEAATLTVILFEIVIGIAVAGKLAFPLTGLICVMMFGIFSIVVAAALLRGRPHVKCGCMLLGASDVIGWHICFRNAALSCLVLPIVLNRSALPFVCIAIAFIAASLVTLNIRDVRIHAARAGARQNS